MSNESNWDRHYKNSFRVIASLLGIKGNLVLNNTISEYILKYSNRYDNFLEIGAGSGRLTKIVSKKFRYCTILDKSEYAIKLAQKICRNCTFIQEDIFNYKKYSYYDAVASVGLIEHFSQDGMEKLLLKSISLVCNDGCLFICIPSYSKEREIFINTSKMIKKYGYQDSKAEFKISTFLDIKSISYTKLYLDRIGSVGILSKLLRYLNILTYSTFKYNIDKHIKLNKGSYVLFIIKKYPV